MMIIRGLLRGAMVLLCFTLAYQLSLVTARGQGEVKTVVAAGLSPGGSVVVLSTGDVYFGLYEASGDGARWQRKGNINSTAPIVDVSLGYDNYVHAVAANGDFFASSNLGQTWVLKGNVIRP